MRTPDLFIIPHPDLLYARSEDRIMPVTPLKAAAKVELVDTDGAKPGEVIDLKKFQPNRLGKYDHSFGLVFAYPEGIDSGTIQDSDIRWGHHLLPFLDSATRCVARSSEAP